MIKVEMYPRIKYSLTSLLCQLWDLAESWCCGGLALEWGLHIRRTAVGMVDSSYITESVAQWAHTIHHWLKGIGAAIWCIAKWFSQITRNMGADNWGHYHGKKLGPYPRFGGRFMDGRWWGYVCICLHVVSKLHCYNVYHDKYISCCWVCSLGKDKFYMLLFSN